MSSYWKHIQNALNEELVAQEVVAKFAAILMIAQSKPEEKNITGDTVMNLLVR